MQKWKMPWIPARVHKDWYTVPELARELSVCHGTIYRMLKRGVFPVTRLPGDGRLYVRREDFLKTMDESTIPAREEGAVDGLGTGPG